MPLTVKQKEAKRRKSSGETGGGSPPEDDLAPEEVKVLGVIGIESIVGVQGGADTDAPEITPSVLSLPGSIESMVEQSIDISSGPANVNEPSTSSANAESRYALILI